MARVKVGGRWYDGAERPICVQLSEQDKRNIAAMPPDAEFYGVAPDALGGETLSKWMEEGAPARYATTTETELHTDQGGGVSFEAVENGPTPEEEAKADEAEKTEQAADAEAIEEARANGEGTVPLSDVVEENKPEPLPWKAGDVVPEDARLPVGEDPGNPGKVANPAQEQEASDKSVG